MQKPIGSAVVQPNGQATFHGLQLPADYGRQEQQLSHLLCISHPVLQKPLRIAFRVSDKAGLVEAKARLDEKTAAKRDAAVAEVGLHPTFMLCLLIVIGGLKHCTLVDITAQ